MLGCFLLAVLSVIPTDRPALPNSVEKTGIILASVPHPPQRFKSSLMRPEGGALLIRAQPQASVYLNGEWRGRCDERGVLRLTRLPAGAYRLRVRKAGFYEIRRTFPLPHSKGATVGLLMRRDPDQRALQFQRGEDLREERKYAEAIEAYSAAIAEQKAKYPLALIGRARCYLNLGKLDEAFEDARSAAGVPGETRVEAQTVLANVLRAQGQYEEAAEAYRTALRWGGNFSPEAHTGLAITLDELDRPEDAWVHLRAALKQDGDAQPVLYYLLGNVLTKLERDTEAIEAFESFLKRSPDSELAPAVESLLESLKQPRKS